MSLDTMICTKPERNAATVFVGRIALNVLRCTCSLEQHRRRRLLLERKWIPGAYVHFTISERGKTRPIDAPRIQDRQVHKVYTKKVLLPLYRPEMIYNNGASLEGKGFEFSKRMLKEDLRWHFRRYGRDGNVILIDFKQFFPSVSHEEIFKRHEKLLLNPDIRKSETMLSTLFRAELVYRLVSSQVRQK